MRADWRAPAAPRNAFVRLTVDGKTARSKVVPKQLSPRFAQQFEFSVTGKTSSVHFAVCDNRLTTDDVIGTATISMGTLVDNATKEVLLDLENSMSGKLSVAVTLSWLKKTTTTQSVEALRDEVCARCATAVCEPSSPAHVARTRRSLAALLTHCCVRRTRVRAERYTTSFMMRARFTASGW